MWMEIRIRLDYLCGHFGAVVLPLWRFKYYYCGDLSTVVLPLWKFQYSCIIIIMEISVQLYCHCGDFSTVVLLLLWRFQYSCIATVEIAGQLYYYYYGDFSTVVLPLWRFQCCFIATGDFNTCHANITVHLYYHCGDFSAV